jgi:GH15 family glucan-1,4-alpha-glucosidase
MPGQAEETDASQNRGLREDGFVRRYQSDGGVDGLTGTEGAFLMTTFWLADNLALMGRSGEARDIFKRLLGVRNAVGLLSEEYDSAVGRMLGNFPQAFSHVALITTAANLSMAKGPSQMRSTRLSGAPKPSSSRSSGGPRP